MKRLSNQVTLEHFPFTRASNEYHRRGCYLCRIHSCIQTHVHTHAHSKGTLFAGGQELTDLTIIKLAKEISTRIQLAELGARLGITLNTTMGIINDNKNISDAALDVLQEWQKTQCSRATASAVVRTVLEEMGELDILRKCLHTSSE